MEKYQLLLVINLKKESSLKMYYYVVLLIIPLTFDPLSDKWSTTMRLEKGKHLYKYIVDNNWIINPIERHERGKDGFDNNIVEI